MYELPASLLVANPINRYLINSPMLPQLKRDADGGLTLLVQNESPGKDKEANWLPRRRGPSSCICASIGRKTKHWKASGPHRRFVVRSKLSSTFSFFQCRVRRCGTAHVDCYF
jgi:hypothetical protein